MKRSSTLCVFSFALSICAVSPVGAAPAPVSALGDTSTTLKRLEHQFQIRNKVQLDMQNQLASLLREIDELRGTVEKNRYELNAMAERQRELYKEIDDLKQNNSSTSKKVATQTQTKNKTAVYSENHSENAQYNAAVDLILKNKDYAGGMKSFEDFIRKYPKSVYAPNVYYWLGQLNFSKGELSTAKKNFTLVTEYDKSNKKPEALLKLGVIATRQNDVATANKLYQQLVSQYPSTESAKEAQKLLKK